MRTRSRRTDRGRIDSGWLFLLAGAALLVAVTLIPPGDDLAVLRHRRDEMQVREQEFVARLEAYSTFLDAIEEEDPDLIRRLALAQLNLVPEDETPMALLGAAPDASVERWISATLPEPATVEPIHFRETWLRRFSTGTERLWTMAVGASLVFIGLLPRATRPANRVLDDSATDESESASG
ncbi:MAG: hypothetical protein ACF8PN_17095 [Phycisphaerales bacterium]